eukprot:TRINITY_DN1432_c0_g1_i1.p1 TRINITY_DN1432_c0_g1~~TRINITY_DN1432_c0_g1_i1.p1  ORF type:complete len:152 (-),score=16.35 TRINITY_DN1432_c0_g1_i1:415-870(-)
MSTDRATGGDELDAKPVYCDENGGGDSKRMNVDDYHADMLDKLRSDDFKGLVQSANDAHDKQNEQMCLGSDGSITKANPYTAYAHRSTVGTGTHDSLKPQPVSAQACLPAPGRTPSDPVAAARASTRAREWCRWRQPRQRPSARPRSRMPT